MGVAIGIVLGGTRTKIGLKGKGNIIASEKGPASPEDSLLVHFPDAIDVVEKTVKAKAISQGDLSGGGLMKSKEEILRAVREMINRHAWTTPPGTTASVEAAQVENAGLLGINCLVNQL